MVVMINIIAEIRLSCHAWFISAFQPDAVVQGGVGVNK
jgi:hypothetical protein